MADSKSIKKNDTDVKKAKKPNKIQRWWRETVGELRKVTWPTKEDAWKMTKVTILVVILSSVFLGLVDFIFSRLIGLLIG